MRIPRIFTPQPLTVGLGLELEPQASIHLGRVLRLQPGHPLVLFNGEGGEYSAQICSAGKKAVAVEILNYQAVENESPLATEICVGVSKGDKMDLIVQKCTELGASCISPVITERSDVKLNQERWEKKLSHWQQVAVSACEQCGRNRLPQILPVRSFHDWLPQRQFSKAGIFHPGGNTSLPQVLSSSGEGISLCFGSEGGFSDGEIQAAQAAGVTLVGLGPRVLRAETAPIAVLGALQTLWGDWR